MIGEERRARIVDMVNTYGTVTVTDLMEDLGASESTVRRDLGHLHKAGLLKRVHGGATKLSTFEVVLANTTLESRQFEQMEEKRAIGAYAARLIKPDDFVFIDGGSTADCLVDAITETHATYYTNSLPLAQKLRAKGCHTFLPGGEVSPVSVVLVGSDTVDHIRKCHFTVGFWGTNGADPENGFTTPGFEEAAVKQVSFEHTMRRYVICDSSKFKTISLIKFADFDDATIITDYLEEQSYHEVGTVVEVMREESAEAL